MALPINVSLDQGCVLTKKLATTHPSLTITRLDCQLW
jgi:hypothetical protein